ERRQEKAETEQRLAPSLAQRGAEGRDQEAEDREEERPALAPREDEETEDVEPDGVAASVMAEVEIAERAHRRHRVVALVLQRPEVDVIDVVVRSVVRLDVADRREVHSRHPLALEH